MKAGDNLDCPHCGKSSFVKKESVMDGWTKVGDIFACASCSIKLADVLNLEETTSKERENISTASLAALLGTEKEEKTKIAVSEDEKLFCRDCLHFIVHPFLSRCELHAKEVSPMSDCSDFEPKKEDDE